MTYVPKNKDVGDRREDRDDDSTCLEANGVAKNLQMSNNQMFSFACPALQPSNTASRLLHYYYYHIDDRFAQEDARELERD